MIKIELDDLTIDEMNDLCAKHFFSLNIKPTMRKAKVISLIKKELSSRNMSIDYFVSLKKVEDEEIITPQNPLCDRCKNELILIDKSNNDYKCNKCGAKVTIMR